MGGFGMTELIVLVGFCSLVVFVYKLVRRRKKAPPLQKSRAAVQQSRSEPGKSPAESKELSLESHTTAGKIFLSYRRDDSSDITGRIYDRLTQHFGADRVFKDVDSIPLGVDFKQHLSLAVSQCNVFLAVIGTDWLSVSAATGQSHIHDASDFVRIEVESALERQIPVIPLLVQKTTIPAEKDLPESLKPLIYRNGLSIRPDPDFHHDMDRLIRAIESHST